MKRALRIGGTALAVLLVAVGAAAAFLASPWFADLAKAQVVEALRHRHQRSLRIDGPLVFSFYPQLGFDVAGVALSERGDAAEFAGFAAMRLGVAVVPLFSRRVVVDACELSGLRATVVRRRDGTLNVDDLLAPTEPAGQPWQIEVPACRLAATALAWRDERQGGGIALQNLELTGAGLYADTGAKTLRAERLELAVRAGAARARLAAGGVAASPAKLAVDRLATDFELAAADAVVKGKLASPFAADFAGRTLALGELAGSLAVAHPRLTHALDLPLHGTLRADLGRQSAAGRLTARLDDSQLALKLAVTRFTPPRLAFELDIDRLDLDRYLKPAQAAAKKAPTRKKAVAKTDAAKLAGLDASGTVRIGSLSVGAVKASSVTLRVASVDGRLDTEALEALAGN